MVKHPGLLTFLADRDYRTERGVGWASLVLRYLADSLGLEMNVLKSTCQVADGIAELVDRYGPGIFLILPSNAGDR